MLLKCKDTTKTNNTKATSNDKYTKRNKDIILNNEELLAPIEGHILIAWATFLDVAT